MNNNIIEEKNTFIGIVSSKKELLNVLEAALHFRQKWTFYKTKKLFFISEYNVIISGDYAKNFEHYFAKFLPATAMEITKLKRAYQKKIS